MFNIIDNIYVFSLQVSETQTYYAGGLQTPSKSILTLLPGYIALVNLIEFVVCNSILYKYHLPDVRLSTFIEFSNSM